MSPLIVGDASRARPGGDLLYLIRIELSESLKKIMLLMGNRLEAFEVDILTENDYSDHEIIESPLLNKSGFGWNKYGMHNFDPWWTGKEWICAVDGLGNSGWSIGIYTGKKYPNGFVDVPPGYWAEDYILRDF